jgi:hypothetical protein
MVQLGEQVRTLVTVKNIGLGRAVHTEAILRNGSGQQGVLISAGRFDAKELAPGQTKTFSFVYEVRPELKGEDFQLELMVADTTLGEHVTDKIKVKVGQPGKAPDTLSGTLTITRDDTALREAPVEGSLVVGRASKGAVFKVNGKLGAFTRVELENGRSAFIASVEGQPGGTPRGGFRPEWQVTPPVVTVSAPTVVNGETVRLRGQVTDDHLVRDLYVRVWNRKAQPPIKKVYYKPNKSGDRTRMDFEADVTLWPGSNTIEVYARESNEVQSRHRLVVLRRNPASVYATPGVKPEAAPTR